MSLAHCAVCISDKPMLTGAKDQNGQVKVPICDYRDPVGTA